MIHLPWCVPPVGSPIRRRLRGRSSTFDWTFGGRYRPVFVDSGTTALRLALAAASRRSDHRGPVWVPAYGCPDLLSATTAAGCTAAFYDVGKEVPYFADGQRPPSGLVAAIAAHFVGLVHPPEGILSAIAASGAVLIEDSAQRFPSPEDHLYGDAVVLSFGRGKPLSLMEGGCLLVGERLAQHVDAIVERYATWTPGADGTIKRWLHDIALRPAAFGLLRSLPGLGLGQVICEPAPMPRRTDEILGRLAGRAAAGYLAESAWASNQLATEAFLGQSFPGLRLMHPTAATNPIRLSRIPCLATDAEDAARTCERASRIGCSATRMYGHALPQVQGVPAGIPGPWENAASLAERLVTFPVMEPPTIDRVRSAIESTHRQRHG